jgi:hypothetical protein
MKKPPPKPKPKPDVNKDKDEIKITRDPTRLYNKYANKFIDRQNHNLTPNRIEFKEEP